MRLDGPAVVVEEVDLDYLLSELDEMRATLERAHAYANEAIHALDTVAKAIREIKDE